MITTNRRKTKKVYAGKLAIGGDSPISVQTMTNIPFADIDATIDQIYEIAESGGELVRIAVPNIEFAKKISKIVDKSPIPVSADIHFDERIALEALNSGVDKLRLNPGNLIHKERLPEIAKHASERHVPIRIGVNEGSLDKNLLKKYGSPTAEALVESALNEVKLFEEIGFFDLVISVKTFSLPLMIEVHKLLTEKTDYPLHIGVTEAGIPYTGIIRSSAGIGALLLAGIGDTIRVSLTGSPVEEVKAGWEILKSTESRRRGATVISCPCCGRTAINVQNLAQQVTKEIENYTTPITVAVMGCAVNGPGEARLADVGIAGGRGEGIIFKKGEIIKKVPEDKLFESLMKEIENI